MKLPKFHSKYILLTKLYVSSIFVMEFERGIEGKVQKKTFANKKKSENKTYDGVKPTPMGSTKQKS